MRRGLRLSVSNDGGGAAAAVAGASAAAAVVDADDGLLVLEDKVTEGPERELETTRPSASRHIAVRRSLRVFRRRWHRMTPVQRVVLVAAAVAPCVGVLRLGGGGHWGGEDLPVASLAAVTTGQKQEQQEQQQRRKAQAAAGAGPRGGGAKKAAGAGAAEAAAASGSKAAAEPTPPAPAKPKAAAKKGKQPAARAAVVGPAGKQQHKASAASPLSARNKRKAKRKGKAAAAATKKKTTTTGSGSTAKRKAAAPTSSAASMSKGKGKGKGKNRKAAEPATAVTKEETPEAALEHPAAAAAAAVEAAAGAEDHRRAASEAGMEEAAAAAVAESPVSAAAPAPGKGEEEEEEEAAGGVEDGDALPGVAGGDGGDGADASTGAGAASSEEEEQVDEEKAGQGAEEEEGKEEEEKHESLPKLFYCLPNGGFNDICVETWYCVDYARRTGRALVWGYHNYIPQVPPYEPYFTLRPIENVTQLSQAEAAGLLLAERARRKAQGRFQRIKIHPRRLKIDFLLGEDDVGKARKAKGNPLFINAPGMPQFRFNFSAPHQRADVAVFHKIGNQGSGFETLKHLRFSDEVKRTFLARWRQLSQPYIGLHVRSTDRSCPREKIERLLKHTRQLSRSRALEGADVYLATDNPDDSEEFLLELRDKQARAIRSFTFIPAEDEDGDRQPLHLNRNLQPAEKHQTNVDGFVDLLLLAFCDHFIKTCGGYGRLAQHLHQDKATALSLIGEALEYEGQEVNDVLAAAVARLQQDVAEEEKGDEGSSGDGTAEMR